MTSHIMNLLSHRQPWKGKEYIPTYDVKGAFDNKGWESLGYDNVLLLLVFSV